MDNSYFILFLKTHCLNGMDRLYENTAEYIFT